MSLVILGLELEEEDLSIIGEDISGGPRLSSADEASGGGPNIFFHKESEEPSRKRRVYPCATWRINGQLFEGRWRRRERCGQYGKQQESSCYEEMVMLEIQRRAATER
jgi:hypothetical protein